MQCKGISNHNTILQNCKPKKRLILNMYLIMKIIFFKHCLIINFAYNSLCQCHIKFKIFLKDSRKLKNQQGFIYYVSTLLRPFCIPRLRRKSSYALTSDSSLSQQRLNLFPSHGAKRQICFVTIAPAFNGKGAAYTPNTRHRKEFRARFTCRRQRRTQVWGGGGELK